MAHYGTEKSRFAITVPEHQSWENCHMSFTGGGRPTAALLKRAHLLEETRPLNHPLLKRRRHVRHAHASGKPSVSGCKMGGMSAADAAPTFGPPLVLLAAFASARPLTAAGA